MAKKQKKAKPERIPTKRQLSKWQREKKIRRIVIIAAVVFLAGILSYVGYGYYNGYKNDPMRELVIQVNGVPFSMEYFVKTLDTSTQGMNSTVIYQYGNYLANMVADSIIDAELLRQGAKEDLDIEVTAEEISTELEERDLPNDRVYQDMIRAVLLETKVREHFGASLNDTMEQARVQVMVVESEKVADEIMTRVESGTNFTALVDEFSCNSSVEGDLGWLPEELMPNALIANAAFNPTPGETIHRIYDGTASKEVGYWLIEVTDKRDDEIKARAMLLGSEAEAERVEAELTAGGNFSSLAAEYSQHESKAEGGELDWFKQGDMGSNAFDQVAFNITLNEVSEPVKDTSVKTTGGYWLVMVTDSGERELEEGIREDLIDKRYNDWRQEWTEKSTIETHLEADKISWAVNKVLEAR